MAAAEALPLAASASTAPSDAASLSRFCSRSALSSVARQGRDLGLVRALLGALQRQEVGQLLDLPIELGERLVLARDLPRQEELRQHEHRQQKNDDEQHRRQSVDEARPIVHRLVAASARQRHRSTPSRPRALLPSASPGGLPRSQLVQQAAQELADVLLLHGLRVDPVANLLLLGAHVADQRLNAFGERRDRLGVALMLDRRLRACGDDRRLRQRLDERRRSGRGWRETPRIRNRSDSAPARPGGRESRGSASWRGRTARR